MRDQKWDTDEIEDQTGKVAIVTGSSSGLGLETARVLAQKGARVIIAARNAEKLKAALDDISGQYPDAEMASISLDLAGLSAVKAFASEVMHKYSRLDLLINNAGVMIPPYQMTRDGFELQMGTNHLGHFALTGRLMPMLKETTQSRIVNVSSMAHKIGNIVLDDLNWEKRPYKKWQAYGDSKIANLYFMFALQNRLDQLNLNTIATAAHPGWTATQLQRHTGLGAFFNPFFAQPPSMGALPILRAATAKDVKGNDFFGPSGFMEIKGYPQKVKPNKRAMDPDIAERLFSLSEELTGVKF